MLNEAPNTSDKILRAAEYVRMSTDQQQFSIAYQQAAIRLYAAQRGMAVVKTYADEGRSGLTLRERPAMLRLLADVEARQADYEVILVYDVSRWGRYQDTDEGAFHEFRCRLAGKRIEYCAEQFTNDAGPIAAVLKAIKRAMAAEYSRELAVRTGAAQARTTAQGYLHGGSAGYGLRRMLVDQIGRPKGLLPKGVRKNVRTERVALVAGPSEELAVVRRIFDMFVNQHMFIYRIASVLNGEGVPYVADRPWNHQAIRYILHNERYLGNIVFDQTTSNLRLGKGAEGRVKNPSSQWVRGRAGYPPIVPPELFAAANRIKPKQNFWYRTDEALLEPLRKLLEKRGYLSMSLIASTKGIPGYQTYCRRFGGIREAYARIGYKFKPNHMGTQHYRDSRKLILDLVPKILRSAKRLGLDATWEWRSRRFFFAESHKTIGIGIARYVPTRHDTSPYWVVHTKHKAKPSFLIVAKMASENAGAYVYYVLPSDVIAQEHTSFDRAGLLEQFKCKDAEAAINAALEAIAGASAGRSPIPRNCRSRRRKCATSRVEGEKPRRRNSSSRR